MKPHSKKVKIADNMVVPLKLFRKVRRESITWKEGNAWPGIRGKIKKAVNMENFLSFHRRGKPGKEKCRQKQLTKGMYESE